MRLRGLCVVSIALASACAVEPRADDAPLGSQRAAVDVLNQSPLVTGRAVGARLGSDLVACPDGGFVASSPGDRHAWFSLVDDQPRALPWDGGGDPNLKSLPIGCRALPSGEVQGFATVNLKAFLVLKDGGAPVFASFGVEAFAVPPPQSGFPLVLATSGSVVGLQTVSADAPVFSSDGGGVLLSQLTAPIAASWSRSGQLVLGGETSEEVVPYQWSSASQRLLQPNPPIPNPDGPGNAARFGHAVLQGDVLPGGGEELVISAPGLGLVFIYSGSTMVLKLASSPAFGSSLALDPRDLGGGLHAFWVGDPTVGSIYRYVGDAGLEIAGPLGAAQMGFGAALAVDSHGTVAIGAPDYEDLGYLGVGAVYLASIDAGLPFGEPQPCDAGSPCLASNCRAGTCVGGVICASLATTCSLFQTCSGVTNTCVPDAGVVDAGVVDAGVVDAGVVDAGVVDAGVVDAGVVDAGSADAGSVDAGSVDAGTADAGEPDAGATDGGKPDAGSKVDGGTKLDGGTQVDAGLEPLVFRPSGCSASSALPLTLVVLSLLRRRRATRNLEATSNSLSP